MTVSSSVSAAADLLAWDDVVTSFDPVLGLEVHVELSTATKMFCGCPTTFGAPPNTQVCPTCLGLPGSLPVTNRQAIESAIRIGLALNCEIAPWCRFARKNYFYPDMPKNFQISQYDEPIAYNGYLDLEVDTPDGPRTFRVGIERAHIEEDTGKTSHEGGSTGRIHGAEYSLVDYNRAGIPLIEIVSKPIENTGELAPHVARQFVSELRDLMRALNVSDVRMEQGSLRCDVNVSLRRTAQDPYGLRTETKNVNSLRSVERAVRYEMQRQAAVISSGGRVTQETRHWHEDTGLTTPGRSKEQAEDYRYFPEPDLVPLAPAHEWITELSTTLPEKPSERRRRLQGEWGFTDLEMRDVVNAGALGLVEATVAAGATPSGAKKWWLTEIAREANEKGTELAATGITPTEVARVDEHVRSGKLNDKLARQVIEWVLAGEGSPDEVMKRYELTVVSDDTALLKAVDEAIEANPDVAEKIRNGKLAAVGALVGAVMKATRGQADAAGVRELILQRLTT
jgi:aspartyl-tRNA(Asn)/glutamyl-tRNA(Gln) amidotransferase subunit B